MQTSIPGIHLSCDRVLRALETKDLRKTLSTRTFSGQEGTSHECPERLTVMLGVLRRAGCSHTKSFKPSTSLAVLWTVPSLLGAFSLGPSLVAAEDAGLGALCPLSSAPPRPLLCFIPFCAPYCCGLKPLLPEPPAAVDRGPFETFW